MLIVDGSAMRPPIGSVTLKKVPGGRSRARARPRGSGRDGLEAGAEVLGVEGAAPDHHASQAAVNGVEAKIGPSCGQPEEEEEDLHEDRRVADHLDVDRRRAG